MVERFSSSISESRSRHRSIDGLRGFAVLLVLTGHTLAKFGANLPGPLSFFDNGGRGVTIFFVISGFLITTILLKEKEKTRSVSLKSFYTRRTLRILPAFYVYLGSIVLLSALGTPVKVSGSELLAAGLFVWNYANVPGSWWLGHTWSLAIEEQFYILWPLALVLLKRRVAAWIAGGILLAIPLLRVGQYFLLPAARDRIPVEFHTRMDALVMGCLLAILMSNNEWRRQVAKLSTFWPIAVIYLAILGPTFDYAAKGAYELSVGWSFEQLCAAIIIATIVAKPQARISRFLAWKPLTLIGTISYSLYLWQQLYTSSTWSGVLANPIFVVIAAIATAALSYKVVEVPFLSLKRRFERSSPDLRPGM